MKSTITLGLMMAALFVIYIYVRFGCVYRCSLSWLVRIFYVYLVASNHFYFGIFFFVFVINFFTHCLFDCNVSTFQIIV